MGAFEEDTSFGCREWAKSQSGSMWCMEQILKLRFHELYGITENKKTRVTDYFTLIEEVRNRTLG